MQPIEQPLKLLREDVRDEETLFSFKALLPDILQGAAELVIASLEPPDIEGFAVVQEIDRFNGKILHVILMVGIDPTIEKLIERCKEIVKERGLAGSYILKEL